MRDIDPRQDGQGAREEAIYIPDNAELLGVLDGLPQSLRSHRDHAALFVHFVKVHQWGRPEDEPNGDRYTRAAFVHPAAVDTGPAACAAAPVLVRSGRAAHGHVQRRPTVEGLRGCRPL